MDHPPSAPIRPLTQAELNSALLTAAENSQSEQVTALINQGADLNAADQWGRSALILAAERGHAAIVTALLSNPQFDAATLNTTNQWGSTALMRAAENGHNEVAFRLLNSMSTDAIVATRPNPSFLGRVLFRAPVITPIEASYHQALTTLRQGLRNMVGAFNEQDSRPNLGTANALMEIIADYYTTDWCLNPNREMQLVSREITNPPLILSRTSNAFNRLMNAAEPRAEQGPSKNPRRD